MKFLKKALAAVAVVVVLLLVIGMATGGSKKSNSGSNESSSSASQEQTTENEAKDAGKAEDKVEENAANSKYAVTIDEAYVGENYAGDPCLFVTYTFTNVSDDKPASFAWSVSDEVYQNGLECETTIADVDNSNYTAKVKTGNSIQVKQAYELQDTTTDVEIEITELIAFERTVIASQTFHIA